MSRVLATRLKRLEKRLRIRRPMAAIIMGIYPDEAPGRILGIDGGGMFLPAMAGEALPELQRRAVAALPARMLAIRYSTPTARQSDVAAPVAVPAPFAPPMPGVGDPGVGRVASLAELQRWGAVPVPPERIV